MMRYQLVYRLVCVELCSKEIDPVSKHLQQAEVEGNTG